MNIHDIMKASPVMPVLVIDNPDQAVPLANALVAGGIRTLEVTLRTAAALDAVRRIRAAVPDAIVGVGTITRVTDIAASIKAGAQFGVSPGATSALLGAARAGAWPFLPGVATPSDILLAIEHGFDAMKFFPAEAAGGIPMLKSLAGPFANIRFCPTGGIDLAKAREYLKQPNVTCVGGSWLVPSAAIKANDWNTLEQLAREAAGLREA
ncbi:MAG: bifunctional 4-hydroxy-2-oxoglutarate aldolase/2-dehydro-3-deoxy-phosphogluconate aldolase [Betaproteobacteria bacterium]|nr:bifunctional 4-hydroxy-2-oxoglutarate aldolase/2-dehydro-3-deoxy-phosphogluconate aldolase [Betaproteobacteria bacterium]